MDPDPDHAALLESMATGLYLVDRDRIITHWNRAAEGITGYASEQVLGRWCGDGLLDHVDEAGESLCGSRCPLRMTITDGRTRSVRVYLHHREGHLVPVRVTAAPLRSPEGEIVGAVETFSDDSAMSSALDQLRRAQRLAATDPLTGVGNRRHLDACLGRRLADWNREGRRFGALVIDLDHFKAVNDTRGHLAGDTVLSTVARSLAHALRDGDDVARFGGEEFVVLAEAETEEELVTLAARVRMIIAQGRYAGSDDLAVTASVGVALVWPQDSGQDLLERADRALLEAKRSGRDATVVGD